MSDGIMSSAVFRWAKVLDLGLPLALPSAFQHYLYLQELYLRLSQCQVYIIIPEVIYILIRNESFEFGVVVVIDYFIPKDRLCIRSSHARLFN